MTGAAPGLQAFVALAAFAGLRLGEAAALQLGDIDFLRRTIDVRRQVQNGTDLSSPKYGSERTIYASEELLSLLSQHIAVHPPSGREQWLFYGPEGQPLHQNSVGYQWRRACRRADVQGFTLHDLRHYFASGLIAAGCDVVTVQRALGHSKPSITLDTYSHLWPTAEDRTRAASGGMLADALGILADSVRTG